MAVGGTQEDRERAGHVEAMPGRLNMEEQGIASESQGLKKDRSHVSGAGAPHAAGLENQPQTNGSAANGSNGVLPNGISHGDERNGNDSTLADSGPPPPLDQSWRDTPYNVSLGKLLIRTAESCWDELNTTLTAMAAEPLPPLGNGANGATPAEDTDAVSLRKKRQLMKFAQDQRDARANIEHVCAREGRTAVVVGKIIDEMLEDDGVVGINPGGA